MANFIGLLYGLAAYVFFLGTFLYAIGFVGNVAVPKSIDSGVAGPLMPSVLIDVALLAVFAVQHSVMARQGFKRVWTKIVPKSVERGTYVVFASLALALLCWQWRPIVEPVWTVAAPTWRHIIEGLFWTGFLVLLAATFMINHFELFGLQQVFDALRGKEAAPVTFKKPGLYKSVRHPIYLGFIIAFWAAPDMTVGHLLFSVATTAYIFIGIWFEERDLIRQFGDAYRQYKREVRMVLPWPKRRRDSAS